MYILGVDPGLHTGLVLATRENDTLTVIQHTTIDSITINDLDNFVPEVARNDLKILMESMVHTGNLTGAKIAQIKAITVVECFALIVERKLGHITPEARRRLSGAVPPEIHGEHARDAYRVIVAWGRQYAWQP